MVAPDTSPRGADVPNDPAYDLGQGAGFYLNATQAPRPRTSAWKTTWPMSCPRWSRRISRPARSAASAAIPMGGHGALTLALRHPGRYASVSAFAHQAAPSAVPWGQKAFTAYLGEDRGTRAAHDTVALIANATERLPLLVRC